MFPTTMEKSVQCPASKLRARFSTAWGLWPRDEKFICRCDEETIKTLSSVLIVKSSRFFGFFEGGEASQATYRRVDSFTVRAPSILQSPDESRFQNITSSTRGPAGLPRLIAWGFSVVIDGNVSVATVDAALFALL
jgi:hypothetical protein